MYVGLEWMVLKGKGDKYVQSTYKFQERWISASGYVDEDLHDPKKCAILGINNDIARSVLMRGSSQFQDHA